MCETNLGRVSLVRWFCPGVEKPETGFLIIYRMKKAITICDGFN